MVSYKLGNIPPNVDNILSENQPNEKTARQELRTILNKFTKNNIKLTIPLDMNLLVDLLKMFIDCTLTHISVKFTNLKALNKAIKDF